MDCVAKRSDRGAFTVLKYGMDKRRVGVGLPAGATDLSVLKNVQTGSGAHSVLCLKWYRGVGVLSFVVEAAGG